MKKILFVVLVMGLLGVANAGDIKFTDAGADHLWSNPANWNGGIVPADSSTGAAFKDEGTLVQITDGIDAVSKGFMLGMYGKTNSAEISGGSLTAKWIDVGRCNQNGGDGLLTMTGGTVNVNGKLSVATVFNTYLDGTKTANGQVNLWGGTIFADQLWVGPGAGITGLNGGSGNIDIKNDGTLVLNTREMALDETAAFEALITGFNITGYGDGANAVYDFAYTEHVDPLMTSVTTTITAIPEPATLLLLSLGGLALRRRK